MSGGGGSQSLRWALVWIGLLAVPLVPFSIMVASGHDPFQALAESVRGRAAAGVVCFALLGSDVLLPIPSSFVAVVSGQALGAVGGALVNWAGATLGHMLGFALARRWGRPWVVRFVGEEGTERAADLWERGGAVSLMLSRPVPVLAESLSMFAGLTRMRPVSYLGIVALANLPHSVIYAWAGARVHDLASLNLLIAAGVGVPTGGWIIFTLASRARVSGR